MVNYCIMYIYMHALYNILYYTVHIYKYTLYTKPYCSSQYCLQEGVIYIASFGFLGQKSAQL